MSRGLTIGFGQVPLTVPAARGLVTVEGPSAVFSSNAVGTVATPVISPVTGTYTGSQTVSITCSTPSSSIYYTTDGSTPTFPITGTTQLYVGTFVVSVTGTVNAIATATGLLTSSLASVSYTISSGAGFYPAGHWIAANQTLQMIYPLNDAVTSTTARHHWAYYDGVNSIQYQIPIVALGGAYPYVFTLDSGSAALGMTIGQGFGNTNYGLLTWSPAGVVTGHTVTVTVTDQQMNAVQAIFTISTSSSTSHFVFLDAASGSDSAGAGTFGSPWQTLQKAFGGTYVSTGAGAGAICYAKATATYPTTGVMYTDSTDINPSPWFEMNTTRKPVALIGLSGQAVIDMTSGIYGLALGTSATDFFDANLNPNGFSGAVPNQKWMFIASGVGQLRYTELGVTWTNSGYGSAGSDVATPHYGNALGGGYRSYIAMINFTEPSRVSGLTGNNYPGHAMYSCQNWVSDGFTINNPSATYDAICYAKGDNANFEMRNHFINVAGAGTGGVCTTPGFQPDATVSTNGEVRYCYVGQDPSGGNATRLRIGTQAGTYGTFYFNRNTVIGFFENAFGGTGVYQNNVVQTTGTPIPTGGGSTSSGNITGTSAIINSSNLQLEGTALSSVGTAGAQIA